MEYREIKFRGFSIKTEKWVYGGYVEYDRAFFIFDNDSGNTFISKFISIHKKSRGQFTGMYDKNKKEVYEGDIMKTTYGNYSVELDMGQWQFENFDHYGMYNEFPDFDECEIIGNIYENPNLIK